MHRRVLEDKLARLLECAAFLDAHLPQDAADLAADEVLLAACERKLTLLVEYACDICSTLVSEAGNAVGESYAAVFRRAWQIAFIDQETQIVLERLVRVRNQLVHAYETVLAETTHERCRESISVAKDLGGALTRWFEASR